MPSEQISVSSDPQVAIAVETLGQRERGTIVLVMGATASMLWWPERFCRALANAGFEVVRFDHRDTGLSTTGEPGHVRYGVDDLAADLMGVLDALRIPAAHIVGMSLGGLIGQIAAIRHPDRILSLTLIASEPLGGTSRDMPEIDPAFMAHFEGMSTLDWSDHAAVAEFMLGISRLSAGSGYAFDEASERARIAAEIARSPNIQSAFNHALLAGGTDESVSAGDIRKPVLIIHGTDDRIVPLANGEALAALIPGARLHVIEGLGHQLPRESLNEVTRTLLDFIEACAGNGSTTG